MRKTLPSIEWHAIDACNLTCAFCTHYSNLHPKANRPTIDSAVKEWSAWSEKVRPSEFRILGGEPTLNPDLPILIEAAKEIWQGTRIRVYTNGTNPKAFPMLSRTLQGHMLTVTLHFDDERNAETKRLVQQFVSSGVDVSFNLTDQGRWVAFYRLDPEGKPIPFEDGNPRESWNNCSSKRCHVLRNGRLWKCPQVAFSGTVGIDWPGFKGYSSCSLEDDLDEWLSREEELCCSHCPSRPVIVDNHLS